MAYFIFAAFSLYVESLAQATENREFKQRRFLSDARQTEVRDILQYSAAVRLHFGASRLYNSKTGKHYEFDGVNIY